MTLRSHELLANLEKLEAKQINLGLYTTRVTAEMLHNFLENEAYSPTLEEVRSQLDNLKEQGEVIEWMRNHFRSRVAETVRVLRLLRQRFWHNQSLDDAALLTEDIRVEFRRRQRPRRDAVGIAEAIPREVPATTAQSFRDALDFHQVSGFQARAIQEIFACARAGNPGDQAFIVSGDTGAGKTEAFLFPILLDIATEPQDVRNQDGVRAVLVYPRIRLARNQVSRILRYTGKFHQAGGPRISTGIQNGDLPQDAEAAEKQWQSMVREQQKMIRVDLLETCVTCGQGHYWVSAADPEIDTGCPRLICDQCHHVIDTLYITRAALEHGAPDLLVITDVSLSQWLAREKFSHLWGLWDGERVTPGPRFLVLDEIHLYERLKGAHIARLVKRFQARVKLAYRERHDRMHNPVVLGVSATLHDEQQFLAKLLDIDQHNSERYQALRVIKPELDELEATEGRERYIFIYPRRDSPTRREPSYHVSDLASAIQTVMATMHNLKDADEWRGLAFFDSLNDLRQFRHNYDQDSLTPAALASSLRQPANQAELWKIRTDRTSTFDGRRHRVPDMCGSTCAERSKQGTLDECPHFREGDCWVFAKLHGWNRRLRVADSVYAGASAQLDGKDLIPTSPSLEVGYDDDAIQLIYQHKAPSNAASFIQRRGRAGRSPDDSPVIVTLLWPYRRNDAFYFFHPEALYAPSFDDAPLNAGNFNVQRTHALLAFFDLLACLRRQNIEGIATDRQILDFTQAGWEDIQPSAGILQHYTTLPDPNRPGQVRFVLTHRQTKKKPIWFSGKPVERGWVRVEDRNLVLKGWLAMEAGLSSRILVPAYERLQSLLDPYLDLAGVVSPAFRIHRSYPFLVPPGASLPGPLLAQFGSLGWHAANEQSDGGNWLKTYRHIDWMLQGNDEATTLVVHYPNPDFGQPGHDEEQGERTAPVTFALSELLPGNVSYRLRERKAVHWTPIPPDGQSTFRYPEENVTDENGNAVGRRIVPEFEPIRSDITQKPDSIFGVPAYLDRQFPGLPMMTLKRLRVETFGPPEDEQSPTWLFVPDPTNPGEGHTVERSQLDGALPPGTFAISRRSSTRATSVIIPFVASSRSVAQRQLDPPLNTLFAAIDGFLEQGAAVLGFTRVFSEMDIDVKGAGTGAPNVRLRRRFYAPDPQFDLEGKPRPILVGFSVETQGIRFQVNPDFLRATVDAVLADEYLRLRLRRNFAQYQLGQLTDGWGVFPNDLLDLASVAVDYWLHNIVPAATTEPRALSPELDKDAMLHYFADHRIARPERVAGLAQLIDTVPAFFSTVNETVGVAFRETRAFRDFVQSVALHSLSALLKNLVARLGGVGSDDLVAYADLPILEAVDRSIEPRILIMDTVEGGAGGIAQAFDRLDLTRDRGSLWWMLQLELGNCPIGDGEALVKAVLTQATDAQIADVRAKAGGDHLGGGTREVLLQWLAELGIANPTEDALKVLGRVLFFKDIQIGERPLDPALIRRELYLLRAQLEDGRPAGLPREALVRQAALHADPRERPHVAALRAALSATALPNTDVEHELALQLLALYNTDCDDGCPVCLGTSSDIERHYLAPFLNSRHVLKKLRQLLLKTLPRGDSLASLRASALSPETVQVTSNPGSLANVLDVTLGIAVAADVDDTGQIQGGSVTVVNPENAAGFLEARDGWKERWASDEYCPIETPDGNKVRSRAEYIIATRLWNAGIAYEYEPPLPYRDDDGRTRYIHPDFYLFEHGVYIEYWGRDDPEYLEDRAFKERIYTQLRIVPLSIEKYEVDTSNGTFMEKILARIDRSNMDT